MKPEPAPLQTDHVSQEVLLNLYANESKPKKVTPLDLALVSCLISRKAFDHPIFDSQTTLALRLCTDYKAVKRSLERLDGLGWITYRSRGDGRTKGISLNLGKLPAAQPLRERIGPDAERLVDFYLELKKSVSKKPPIIRGGKLIEPKLRLPRNWKQQQLASAQRLVTRYRSYETASQVVYALFHHQHAGIQAKAKKSLYTLWNAIPHARRIREQARSWELLEEVEKATVGQQVGGETDEQRTLA